MEDKYNWRRIKNVRTQSEVFSGILAVGDTGMAMPIEGKTDLNDVRLYSCTSFYEGHILIGDGVILYETAVGISENKVDMNTYDAATTADERHVIIVSRDGSGLISNIPVHEEGTRQEVGFNKLNTGMERINSINECGQSLVISGKDCIKVYTFPENNTNATTRSASYIVTGCEFRSAFKFTQDDENDFSIVALCDNANDDRCIYIFDKDYGKNNKLNIIKISDLVPNIIVNNIYVNEQGIFCLCEKGVVIFITIDGSESRVYYKGIVSNSVSWNDMIIVNGYAILVGSGNTIEDTIVKIYDLPGMMALCSDNNKPLDGVFAYIKTKTENPSVMAKLVFTPHVLTAGTDNISYIKLSEHGLYDLYKSKNISILEVEYNTRYSMLNTALDDDCVIIGCDITEPVTLTVIYTPEEE